jgi:hypothetical protein
MKSSLLLTVPALVGLTLPAAAQQPPSTPTTTLEAGGLRPPEAVDSTAPAPTESAQPSPEQELEKADREDAGRGLEWIWLNAEIGAQHLGLQTFKGDGLVDPQLVKTTQTGLLYGAGIGARILVFTVGARFRMGTFSDWQLWTLDAEGGFRIPLGRLEPYFNVAAGYAALGSLATEAPAASQADIKGFHARLGLGLDYYLSNTFSVGGNLSGDLLVLSRAAVDGAIASENAEEASIYSKDGSSIGAGTSLTAVVGLHF